MTRAASPFFQGHEYDEFLLAPIGEEKNGMLLSVLSALARQDIDPWQEAARLSRLPRGVATENLCAMIAALPAGAPDPANPQSIAERLTALLPIRGGAASPPRETTPGGAAARRVDAVKYIIAMVLILGLLSFVASFRQPAPVEGAQAPISSVVVPSANPPTSRH